MSVKTTGLRGFWLGVWEWESSSDLQSLPARDIRRAALTTTEARCCLSKGRRDQLSGSVLNPIYLA